MRGVEFTWRPFQIIPCISQACSENDFHISPLLQHAEPPLRHTTPPGKEGRRGDQAAQVKWAATASPVTRFGTPARVVQALRLTSHLPSEPQECIAPRQPHQDMKHQSDWAGRTTAASQECPRALASSFDCFCNCPFHVYLVPIILLHHII